MCRLDGHFPDAVCDHLLHGFFYGRNVKLISFHKKRDDKLTGPCPVDPSILKSIRDVLLDLFDGGFPGGFIAGAEAHDQNCPVCLLIHKNILLFYIFRVCSDYTIAPKKVQFFSRKLLTFSRKSNNILNISKRYVNKNRNTSYKERR